MMVAVTEGAFMEDSPEPGEETTAAEAAAAEAGEEVTVAAESGAERNPAPLSLVVAPTVAVGEVEIEVTTEAEVDEEAEVCTGAGAEVVAVEGTTLASSPVFPCPDIDETLLLFGFDPVDLRLLSVVSAFAPAPVVVVPVPVPSDGEAL
jgi:hypothetical protein